MLLKNRVKPKEIQTRLGHSRISTTLDIYAHITKKMKKDTVDIFEKCLKIIHFKNKNSHEFNLSLGNMWGNSIFTYLNYGYKPLLLLGLILVHFQNSHEGFLWNFDRSNLFHSFLTFFLFFQELTFT